MMRGFITSERFSTTMVYEMDLLVIIAPDTPDPRTSRTHPIFLNYIITENFSKHITKGNTNRITILSTTLSDVCGTFSVVSGVEAPTLTPHIKSSLMNTCPRCRAPHPHTGTSADTRQTVKTVFKMPSRERREIPFSRNYHSTTHTISALLQKRATHPPTSSARVYLLERPTRQTACDKARPSPNSTGVSHVRAEPGARQPERSPRGAHRAPHAAFLTPFSTSRPPAPPALRGRGLPPSSPTPSLAPQRGSRPAPLVRAAPRPATAPCQRTPPMTTFLAPRLSPVGWSSFPTHGRSAAGGRVHSSFRAVCRGPFVPPATAAGRWRHCFTPPSFAHRALRAYALAVALHPRTRSPPPAPRGAPHVRIPRLRFCPAPRRPCPWRRRWVGRRMRARFPAPRLPWLGVFRPGFAPRHIGPRRHRALTVRPRSPPLSTPPSPLARFCMGRLPLLTLPPRAVAFPVLSGFRRGPPAPTDHPPCRRPAFRRGSVCDIFWSGPWPTRLPPPPLAVFLLCSFIPLCVYPWCPALGPRPPARSPAVPVVCLRSPPPCPAKFWLPVFLSLPLLSSRAGAVPATFWWSVHPRVVNVLLRLGRLGCVVRWRFRFPSHRPRRRLVPVPRAVPPHCLAASHFSPLSARGARCAGRGPHGPSGLDTS